MTTRKKTFLVTGSSSGIGRAAAKLFAGRGWDVIATMRSPEKETELNKIDGITVHTLDVTNPKQVKAAAEKFGASTDVVLNNAGYGVVGPLEGMTDEQMIREFDTSTKLDGIPCPNFEICSFRYRRDDDAASTAYFEHFFNLEEEPHAFLRGYHSNCCKIAISLICAIPPELQRVLRGLLYGLSRRQIVRQLPASL